MRDVVLWCLLLLPLLVWFIGGVRLSAQVAKEMAAEDGSHWLGHLVMNDFWKVKSARGRALARRATWWRFGGFVMLPVLWFGSMWMVDWLFGPVPKP